MEFLRKFLSSFLIAVLLFFQGLIYPIVAYAVAAADAISTNEDTMVSTTFATLLGNDTDQTTITSVQNAVNGSVVINGTNVEFTPAANFNGAASYQYTGNDASMATVTVTVNQVNDAPSFDPIADQTIAEDASLQSIISSNISPGPSNESSQTVILSATSSNTSVIPNPSVNMLNPSELRYTPVANANGTATITVTANDGESQNNTFSRILTITVTEVNDSPAITVTSPNGGEIWAGGSSHALTWNASDVDDASNSLIVNLFYAINGVDFTSIITGLSNSGTYTWNPIASLDSSTVKIKATATDLDSPIGTDLSNANFTVDSTVPEIEFYGDITGIEATSPSGATVTYTAPNATDNFDATAPASCTPASGSTFALGDTSVTCTKTDTAGNEASQTSFTVTVQDTAAPVITVSGSNPVTVEIDSAYTDAGATATDDYDGDISGQISIDDFSVDTSQVGSYTVYYDVNDSSSNSAEQKTRTVNVVDTTPPDAPTEVSLTDPINNSNITEQDVTLTGFGEAFATVSYSISDGTNNVTGTGTVADDGSITINANDVSSLSDGTITASITLTDVAGNTGLAGTDTATKDTVVPNTPPAPTVAGDNIINSSEYDEIAITGTAEAGSLVSVTLTDNSESGNSISDTQQLGIDETVYAINLIGSDAYSEGCEGCIGSGLQDGTISVTVTSQDAAGNISNSQDTTVTQDTSAPTITIDPYNTDPTNADVTVTASTEEGSTLNFSSHTFSENGEFEFVATDEAGNTATQTVSINNIDKDPPTVTKLGDNSADVILNTGAILYFGEALSDSTKTKVENALTAGADKELSYEWSDSMNLTITATATTTFLNDVVVSVTDLAGNSAELLIVDSALSSTQKAPDSDGDVTIDSTTSEVVITDPDQAVDLTISSGTTDPKIDVSSFISGGTGDIPQITINSTAGSGNAAAATIAIPATTVTGPSGWGGVIAAPTVTTVTLPETAGETKTLSTAIEVGFTGAKLSFDKAVRLLLTGQAGKRAGYVRTGTAFTEITGTCAADNQATGDALIADGDCRIDVGSDLVIWTKHFTKFASYTQTTNSASSSSSSQALSAASPPSCNDVKPGSAPKLLAAVAGTNSVTLTWDKATGSVSYYLVNYSRVAGKFEYGNPNVGGSSATSYTVGGLSGGTTYYFKLRAGNGCAPGDYSNEISATPGGGFVSTPATGFAEGVLGAKTEAPSQTPVPEVAGAQTEQQLQTETQTNIESQVLQTDSGNFFTNFFGAIFGFIAKLFGR